MLQAKASGDPEKSTMSEALESSLGRWMDPSEHSPRVRVCIEDHGRSHEVAVRGRCQKSELREWV